MHFTKRQRVLFGRLETMIDRVSAGPLPLVIREIWGFGSFFRQKASPRDLDLQVLYAGCTPEYAIFDRVMARLLQLRTAETPIETLHQIRAEIPPSAVGFMEKWVGLFSWGMLSAHLAHIFVYSAEALTHRLLKEGLPKLSLHFAQADRTDHDGTDHPVFFLWSREKPDLRANLQTLESDDQVRPALLQELANFEGQLVHHRKMLQGCEAVFRSAMQEKEKDFNTHEWFESQMRKHGLRYHGWQLEEASDEGLPQDPCWSSLSNSELRDMAEFKRAELKETMANVIVARAAAFAACRFASERPPFAQAPWIALCAYWAVPRTTLSRKKVRDALKSLGLPAERIEEECRCRKTWCFIRDGNENLEVHERDVS